MLLLLYLPVKRLNRIVEAAHTHKIVTHGVVTHRQLECSQARSIPSCTRRSVLKIQSVGRSAHSASQIGPSTAKRKGVVVRRSEGSVQQRREPMNKNRIGGIRRRASWQWTAKPISIKGAGCKSGVYGPNLDLYSPETMNALTISALTKLPLN
jgi:hypothetical protein